MAAAEGYGLDYTMGPSPDDGGSSLSGGTRPGVIFLVALVLWDALFMGKIYVVLHYIFESYVSGQGVKRRWILLLCLLLCTGTGPIIALTALTSTKSIFLLGIVSTAALISPIPIFLILLYFWKLCKRNAGQVDFG